ncbi:MAG: NAD-dependent epimerase/dehydratase family protein [Candidatus Woesearchaeota archaeon]
MNGLRIAVTGPTGDIGRSLLRALERADGVSEVAAMARGPFAPAELGLTKTEYLRGDVLDRVAVEELVRGADVVVHLAVPTAGGRTETEQIDLDGSRTVFEATVEAGASRLIYPSSLAAPHKARLEAVLREIVADSASAAYVFRVCTVAGPDALSLVRNIPYVQLFEVLRRYENPLTAAVLQAVERYPYVKPVLPDPGTRFQLVDHDDVADALTAAVLGRGEPGVYNLAGPGELTVSDLAAELGWYSLPVPESVLESAAELVTRLPLLPAQAQWVEALRQSVIMETGKARSELGWEPRHNARETLRETVEAARRQHLLDLA